MRATILAASLLLGLSSTAWASPADLTEVSVTDQAESARPAKKARSQSARGKAAKRGKAKRGQRAQGQRPQGQRQGQQGQRPQGQRPQGEQGQRPQGRPDHQGQNPQGQNAQDRAAKQHKAHQDRAAHNGKAARDTAAVRHHAATSRPAAHRPASHTVHHVSAKHAQSRQARARAAHRYSSQRHWTHRVRSRHAHAHGWARGIFVYPAPVRVASGPGAPRGGGHADVAGPERELNRAGSFSVGISGGSYISGYEAGGSYGDFGLGFVGRYRITDSLGIEASFSRHQSEDSSRTSAPLSISAQAFAFPWTKVNPYASVGMTWTSRDYHDVYCDGLDNLTFDTSDRLYGPHAGLGIELGVGKRAALNLETKVVAYIDQIPDDPSVPVSMQTNLGMNFYF